MDSKIISHLTDEELLKRAKENKPSPIIDAFSIGFLIGILIYGVAANAFGFAALNPLFLIYLFFIYLFLKKPK